MPTLYYRPTCPYCQKVLSVVEALQVTLELKDTTDPAIAEELVEHGGKRQVPYLVDTERGTSMYESDEIVAYLVAQYGKRAPGLRIHRGSTPGGKENICT